MGGDDVGVTQFAHGAHFRVEPFADTGIGQPIDQRQLQRDLPPKFAVPCEKNSPHAATSQRTHNFVFADRLGQLLPIAIGRRLPGNRQRTERLGKRTFAIRFERQKPVGSFRSWLATITRNQVRDHFRRQAGREQARGGTGAIALLEQHADHVDSTICPESIRGSIAQRVLESLRDEFDPKTWTAFWMTTVEGRTTADAVEVTGLSAASVYQAKSRILRKLRARLAGLL